VAKDYWLDANVFIQAKNGPYGFDIVPGFWEAIEDFAKLGVIRSPVRVLAELTHHQKDDLSKWAVKSSVKTSGLFESSDQAVQRRLEKSLSMYRKSTERFRPSHFWIVRTLG
jgi:hypothetical protein